MGGAPGWNHAGSLVAAFAACACSAGTIAATTGDCPGDTDASGWVDIEDFLTVLGEWGCFDPAGLCTGDVNGDGYVNIEDLLAVLLNWGPCPAAAVSAASAGLDFAEQMLSQEAARFIITKGEVDAAYAHDLWLGTYDPADGDVVILPAEGYIGDPSVNSLVGAMLDAHDHVWAPLPLPSPADKALPTVDQFGTLHVRPVPLTLTGWDGPYFRLTYELLDELPQVRVTSEGVAGTVSHTFTANFRITRKIDYVIISPGRVMIGKNVSVTGALGTHYGIVAGELDGAEADPLVMRSDFYYLNSGLDTKLDTFYAQMALHDTDGDGRISINDPAEQLAIDAAPGIIVDTDQNGFVDDFDLFLAHYDVDGNQAVVYDTVLAGGLPVEFDVDLQLARLIDEANPDRDGDGFPSTADDHSLGWKDGVLDVMDTYAKVRGRLAFAVARAEWEVAHGGSYQTVVHGPIQPGLGEPAVIFEADERELPEITVGNFETALAWFELQVPADPPAAPVDFNAQVAAGLAAGGTLILPTGDPAEINWEAIPYGAQAADDYFDRPIYRDMTFTNVRIPMGLNGLFENCEFRGVTFIETEPDCVHENWNFAGALEQVEIAPGSGIFIYELRFPGVTADLHGVPVPDTKLFSNNVRFHDCTFIGSVAGDTPLEHTHWRNHLQFTGETRFYIHADDPDLDGQPDAADIQAVINAMDIGVLQELRKSSILLPGWSAGIVAFTSDQEADPVDIPEVKLKGTIVAGTLEARGTLDFHGTLMTTFRAVAGEGPLFYGGHPSDFKTAIGFFGPGDCDFGRITLRDDPDRTLPDGIPWHLSVEPAP